MKPDDELEAVFRQWADESKYEELRQEWEAEQDEQNDSFRTMCGIVVLVMVLVWLIGCATPVQVAKAKIPRDIELHCINGNWAVVSESAGEAAAFPRAAACGKGAI